MSKRLPSFLLVDIEKGKKMGNISVKEAGRKGGLALLAKNGNKHFAEIGKKGQETLKKRYPGMASSWGREGGRPKKNNV